MQLAQASCLFITGLETTWLKLTATAAAPEVGGGNKHLAQLGVQRELAHDLANLCKMCREAHGRQ